MEKKTSRIKRSKRTRAKIRDLGVNRLTVFRTPKHIYAQIIDSTGSNVLASACTLDSQVKGDIKYSGNISAASVVGKALAERAKNAGINKVAFDRSGFRYHGRIKALADAARESGLEF
ncbi:MAG: 50S ribosomal protein L18 [Gammaproteobacteria bacterium]|nr:50S ribosomal protein L18 [Gammaproteobacteria bacterium]